MVCGQINTPATLPIYVHMHLMNSKFLAKTVLFQTLPVTLIPGHNIFNHALKSVCQYGNMTVLEER
jgi:hypothetical protein